MAQQGGEMAAVFGGHKPRASLSRDLGDVCIVDPAALRTLSYGSDQELLPHLRWKAVYREAREDLFPQEPQGDLRLEAVFFRQARRHRIELEAAVPGGYRGLNSAVRDRIHQQQGVVRAAAKIYDSGNKDTGVEEGAPQPGHRSRSSSINRATSISVRSPSAACGRATRRLPRRTSWGPATARTSRMEKPSIIISSSAPAVRPSRFRTSAGMTTRPALSMVVVMGVAYHASDSGTGHTMPAMPRYRMALAKEDFKFSSAHFTLFANGGAE